VYSLEEIYIGNELTCPNPLQRDTTCLLPFTDFVQLYANWLHSTNRFNWENNKKRTLSPSVWRHAFWCIFKDVSKDIKPPSITSTERTMSVHYKHELYFPFVFQLHIRRHQGEIVWPLVGTRYCYEVINCGFYSSYVIYCKRYNFHHSIPDDMIYDRIRYMIRYVRYIIWYIWYMIW